MSQPELPPFNRPRTAPKAAPPPPERFEVGATDPVVVEPAPPRRKSGFVTALLGGLLGSAITVGSLWLGGIFERDAAPPAADAVAPPTALVETTVEPANGSSGGSVTIQPFDGDSRVAAVAAKAIPSIVTVEVGDNVSIPSDGASELVYRVFATGSGVVFEPDGYILTNNHVVEDAVITKVVFSDGRRFPAEIVGADPLTDIAVLKIDATGLPSIRFADMSSLAIGDEAIAVGSPLGLEGGPSVTAGVVSAFNRQLNTGPRPNDALYGLLQTDAPITLGSSGGALLNGQAELIGITTAIGVSDVGAEGLGFAVPVDMVDRLAADLIANGEVRHGYLGISVDDAMTESVEGAEVPAGALITGFASGSTIQEAGAQTDDIIVAIGGQPVRTKFDLLSILRTHRAGEQIIISLLRNGESVDVSMELGLRPDDL